MRTIALVALVSMAPVARAAPDLDAAAGGDRHDASDAGAPACPAEVDPERPLAWVDELLRRHRPGWVRIGTGCPAGTALFDGAAPPVAGAERYCYKTVDGVRVKHGSYTRWRDDYEIEERGTYVDGKKDGAWSIFDERGRLVSTEIWNAGSKVGESG